MARLVAVKTCLSLPEALVTMSYLRGHGVTTALNGYHHASAAWFVLFALQGVQLSVLDRDLDRARALLANGAPLAVDEERERADAAVPATFFDIALAVAAFALTGMPLPLWVRRRRV